MKQTQIKLIAKTVFVFKNLKPSNFLQTDPTTTVYTTATSGTTPTVSA
jgi:hypothetical protein